ncbi:MAG: circularly permuted type 2 ATP-grasp protein, partial [Pirellulaceae bacterium]
MVTSPVKSSASQSFFAGYQPPLGAFDELLAGDKPRDHWQSFAHEINQLGTAEFERRWQHAQREMSQNGLAYTSWNETQQRARPWDLDSIPLLIDAADWENVAGGLRQRAKLLEAILQDIYGPQELMKSGLLPPDTIFRHPEFFRALHRQTVPGGRYLHLYSADLGRSPDGRWWVLADRTEAPSGSGFALENRLILSRMLPRVFHRCNVQRLASYFVALKEAVNEVTPQTNNPRVVVLSQGNSSPNYFEDAYLARYLGFTLVEAEDLAVRNQRVMLKTLGGLLQVDVIIRRPNSGACDSLELDGRQSGGIPGLLQASRAGNVAILNPLGSGIIESPIFMAYLPKLCQEVLGEKLALPGLATWWCGEPGRLDDVLARLDQLVIKRAFRARGKEYALMQKLKMADRETLVQMLKENPEQFVAQEMVHRSTLPVREEGKLIPAHIALRAFAVTNASGCHIMPGGLVRVSGKAEPLEISLMAGEKSKDAWILGTTPVSNVTLLKRVDQPLRLKRTGGELPSRVAENLYWLGRNLERADVSARLLRTTITRLTSETALDDVTELVPLLRTLAELGQIETGYAVKEIRQQLPAIESTLLPQIFDHQDPFSLRSIITDIFRITARTRDRVSGDSWRILQRMDKGFSPPGVGSWDMADCLSLLDDLIINLAALGGMVSESMTRTQVYHFLDMGRRIERAYQEVRLLHCCLISYQGAIAPLLEAILEVFDSSMTYRSRYLADLQLGAVLDLVITDDTNPRSVAWQVLELEKHVKRLPREALPATISAEERLATRLTYLIRMIEISALTEEGVLDEDGELSQLLLELAEILPKLSDTISHRYLIHAGPQMRMA